MKKNALTKMKFITLFLFLIINSGFLSAQNTSLNGEPIKLPAIPNETLYVHYNTSLLFTGEYIYFKVYCFEDELKKLSALSKIAYVDLINENNNTVFSQKLNLENGIGYGDYFINTNIPSGKYKLIAYTRWMQNASENNFFEGDIVVINPYQNAQEKLLSNSIDDTIIKSNTEIKPSPKNTTNNIKLSLTKNSFGKREKVVLKLNNNLKESLQGNYSLSVKKLEFNNLPTIKTAKDFNDNFNNNSISISNVNVLPEFRGEVISGQVINTQNNKPIANSKIAFTLAGNPNIFKITTTNKEGIFNFIIEENYLEEYGVVQLLGDQENMETVSITFINPTQKIKNKLSFTDFEIHPNMEQLILQKSIYNQIENAYFSVKPDTLKTVKNPEPFYGNLGVTYILEDYTRFKTLKETFVEIIDDAWTTKSDGINSFYVRPLENSTTKGLLPLLLLDGVVIEDHEFLFGYNPNKIKSISILRDQYQLAGNSYQGIISLNTLENSFVNELNNNKKITVSPLFTTQPQKNYFKQLYTNVEANNSLPDYRSQLLWMPQLNSNSLNKEIYFYTSDNTGLYEISLEGFTENGEPVSLTTYFNVE